MINFTYFDDLIITILTVPREPSYIHETLNNLFRDPEIRRRKIPVHIMIDSDDRSYLSEYEGKNNITLHYLTPEEYAIEKEREPRSRFCYNYVRCIDIAQGRPLVVLEDDVDVRGNFINALEQTVTEMGSHGLNHYILTLCTRNGLNIDPSCYIGRYYIGHLAHGFYGTQGMYYPPSVQKDIRDHLISHGVESYRKPGDLLIGECAVKWQNLYAPSHDLVDHIGTISTGVGTGIGGVPQSITFQKKWEPLLRETDHYAETANAMVASFNYLFQSDFKEPILAFHGDRLLTEAVLCATSYADIFIETGTYHGQSIDYISSVYSELPIYSCEVDLECFNVSSDLLKNKPNVHIDHVPSEMMIEKLIDDNKTRDKVIVSWLDAHGGGELPLAVEVSLLTQSSDQYCIFIDDVELPDQPHFGYDEGINLELIQKVIPKDASVYIPEYQEAPKTHHGLRGWVCIASPMWSGLNLPYLHRLSNVNY